MNNIVDIETPNFVIIDEIKNGQISVNDLTDEQFEKLTTSQKKKAIKNAE